MVKNITELKLRLMTSVFQCNNDACNGQIEIDVDGELAKIPSRCPHCGTNMGFKLISEKSVYDNYKFIKLEEPLELRIGGDTREFKARIDGYQASPNYMIRAGDVCEVACTSTVEYDSKKGLIEPFLDVWHIKPLNSAYEEIRLSDEDIHKIEELSKEEDIFHKIVKSIAPDVYGYENIKEGLVLQMFEGDRPRDGNIKNKDRHLIHILLIGDPGIGKSKLIESIYENSPKAIKSNGAGTTQAGLTATAQKDEVTSSWGMEAGSVVLADGGILTIDEFDKLNNSVMKALNEPMEQMSVSVAKAGLVQTMTARTSILAGANPKYSKFIEGKPLKEQLDIPPSTISRFDLIYVMEDKEDYDKDLDKARKILTKDWQNNQDKIIDNELLKKYITYAKNHIFPRFSDEAIISLTEFYAEVRRVASEDDDTGKPITLRELGAISRLAIARAKVELREIVTAEDSDEAIRIYQESLKTLGLNPLTAGELQNVMSKVEEEILEETEKCVQEVLLDYGNMPSKEMKRIKHHIAILYDIDKSRVNDFYNLAYESILEKIDKGEINYE